MEKKKQEKRKDTSNIGNIAIAGALEETVQRYGSAVKEHVVAYSGKDFENGVTLTKGLKSISKSKVNPNYEHQNIQQQAGFSAEVKVVARENAEAIINKSNQRVVRTDDIGRVNDQLYDVISIDENGNAIDGTGRQLKFLGNSKNDPAGVNTPERVFKALKSKKFDKYWENDAVVEIPSNQYDDVLKQVIEEEERIKKSLQSNKLNSEARIKKEQELQRIQKMRRSLKKSKVSSAEAVEARKNPRLSTVKDVHDISHRAGLEGAKFGAAIGGVMSIGNNLIAYCKGDISFEEAAKQVALDTGKATMTGYATSYAGTAVKGVMQNSSKAYIRTISKTNLPATLVAVTIAVTKSIKRYFDGEINGVQCLQEIGQEGANMVSSALFATIGQIVIPIPVVGGLVGGMIGYAMSTATFGILKSVLENEKRAREERIQIESACKAYIQQMNEYRLYVEKTVDTYLCNQIDLFNQSFTEMLDASNINDTDWFVDSCNKISLQFGGKFITESQDDFDELMLSDEPLLL